MIDANHRAELGRLVRAHRERLTPKHLSERRRTPGLPSQDVPDSLIAMIDSLEHPVYALDRLWSAVAWNPAAAELFESWLRPDSDHNLLRYVFLNPRRCAACADRRAAPGKPILRRYLGGSPVC
jgi:hypothetical protein